MQTTNAYKYNNQEPAFTYSEWKQIENRKKAERIYYIKQKLSGLTLSAIGILIPFMMDGDATASLFILPLGLYLLFTKEKVMMF